MVSTGPDGNNLFDDTLGRLLGVSAKDFTLGINCKTGVIYTAIFFANENGLTLTLNSLVPGARVPKKFLPMIAKLKDRTQPFLIYVAPHALEKFIRRNIGYEELRKHLIVQFRLEGRYHSYYLEISHAFYRLLSEWR